MVDSDVWSKVELGQYEEAIQIFTQHDVPGARAGLYLVTNRPEETFADLEENFARIDKRYVGDGDYALLGIGHWYLARPDSAIAQWRAGLDAPYVDAAGGIRLPTLLLYAGVRLGRAELEKEAQRLFRDHWRKFVRRMKRRKDMTLMTPQTFATPDLWNWPGAIVPFLLGQEDAAWLLRHARESDVETLALRHECQAHFAIAIRALQSGDRALFATSMEACARNRKGWLEKEHYLARWEVQQGYPDPPFAAS